MMKPFGAQWLI